MWRGGAVLETAEHALSDVALFVDGLVVFVLDFAVLARRNDGLGTARVEPFAQGLAVITFVGDKFGRGRQGLDAQLGHLAIVDVAGCQEQDVRATFRVAEGVELGVASALRAAYTMSQGPLFPLPRSGGP